MTATTEPFLIDRWIKSTLSGDAQLLASVNGVQRGRAQLDMPMPYVTFHLVAGNDMMAGFGAIKTHVHSTYQVDVYTAGTSAEDIEPAVRRIYDLLSIVPAKGDLPVETASGSILDCLHTQTRERYGVDQGKEWNAFTMQFEINAMS